MFFVLVKFFGGLLALYWGYRDYPFITVPVGAGIFSIGQFLFGGKEGRNVGSLLLSYVLFFVSMLIPFVVGRGLASMLR